MDTPLLPNGNQTNPQREASATSSRPTIEPEAATQPKTVMSSVQTDRLPPTVANNNCNVTINYNFYDTAVSPHLNMTDQQSVGTETEKDGINPRTDEKESPSPTACKVTPSEMEPSNKTNLDQVNEIQHPQLGESPTTRIPDSHDKPPTTSNTQFENSANETMKEDLAMLEELMKAIRDDANTAWIRADLPDSELQGIIFHRVIQSLPLGPAEIEKDVPAMALVYLEQRLKRCLKIFRDKSVVTNATVDDKIPTSSPAAVAWKDGVETPGAHASAPQKACTSASSDTKQVPASAGSAVNMRQNNLKGPSSDSNDNAEPSSADPTQVFQLNTHKDAHSTSKNHRSDSPSKPKHGGQRSSTEDKCSVLTASDPNNINLSSLGQSEICCLSDCAIMHKSFEEHNLQMKEKSSLSIKEDIKAPKSMISTVSRNDTSEHEDVPLVERLSTLAKNQPRLLPILATDDLRTQKFTAVSIQQVYDYDSQEDKGANSSRYVGLATKLLLAHM